MPDTKTAVITTTIRVPIVLRQYAHSDSEARFFITGDRKSPHDEIRSFCQGLGNAEYYSDKDQENLGYECSETIGWNTIQRRNIAILEAIKWGADVIVTIDDDNIPLPGYFAHVRSALLCGFDGLEVTSLQSSYVNIGDFNQPSFIHRGFPLEYRKRQAYAMNGVSDLKVGVLAGLWLGDPDIDAIERLVNAPNILNYSTVLDHGLSVAEYNFSPFNSQNTSFIRELAPLMMVLPGIGRYDDIWGSYIAQRIMWETGYRLVYGYPYVYQERNPQSLVNNLEKEIYGMGHTLAFCQDLLKVRYASRSVLGMLRETVDYLFLKDYIPDHTRLFLVQWVRDVEKVI